MKAQLYSACLGPRAKALQLHAVVILAAAFAAVAQSSTGLLDESFDPGSGPNGPIHALAYLPDGRVLIAGNFAAVDDTPRPRIARLNADGSLDPAFEKAPLLPQPEELLSS